MYNKIKQKDGNIVELREFLRENNITPDLIWDQNIGKNESIIANCLTLPHNENEMQRKDPEDGYFSYNW